jgi:hypothetical protein
MAQATAPVLDSTFTPPHFRNASSDAGTAPRAGRLEEPPAPPTALLLAHGFTVDMLADLIHAGLATAKIERMVAGDWPMEVTRVRITDAGRRSLAERAK